MLPKLMEQIKVSKEPVIEDKDEYLNKNKKTNHKKPKTRNSSIDRPRRIPTYVAIPLPPLNFNQTGNICPKKQINPARITKSLK